jgi:hypothetical protein
MRLTGVAEYLIRCHCGALSARYQTALPIGRWNVRACQCSFCRAHDALSVSDPAGSLEFRATQVERLQRYRFGSGITEFLLCRECGVYIGARLASGYGNFGIINARALVPISPELPAPVPMDYAGESASDKRTRRSARWTPLTVSSL